MTKQEHKNISFIFFGTDEFAVTVLKELQDAGYVPSLLVTAPDRPKGRGLALTPPPVKVWGAHMGDKILQPEKLDASFVSGLSKESYDLFIVASYGKILPKEILKIPKHGTLNVHPSLLPLFRGSSPVESQILEGAEMTGVTIMRMDEKVDHGDIISQEVFPMPEPLPDAPTLQSFLASEGGKLLARTILPWIAGEIDPQAQDHEVATYTKKIKKEDGLVQIEEESGETLYRKFNAYRGWPGLYFIENGKRIKITDAELKDGNFLIKKVIPEGKKETDYKAFTQGN